MIPDIAKDAGSILHFKRKSNAFADADYPGVLPRFYFL